MKFQWTTIFSSFHRINYQVLCDKKSIQVKYTIELWRKKFTNPKLKNKIRPLKYLAIYPLKHLFTSITFTEIPNAKAINDL